MSKLPTIRDARALTKARQLTGALIVGFSGDGQLAIASYGSTVARCRALGKLNDAIADLVDAGDVDLTALRETPGGQS